MPRRGELDSYRQKRTPGRTPEPFGEAAESAGPLRFVVQQHAARRLHWDLRLEWGGVLLSWAVPKGPSYDPKDKQLAVQTEDHPLEYADFEGVIPKGEYGGGAMIVWDRGQWLPVEDPAAGLESGKLLFELRGYKLRGSWTLVKLKKEPRSWLLIKERDAWARAGDGAGEPLDPRSVFSGLTVEELGAGAQRAAELRRAARQLGAPERRVEVESAKAMLAEIADRPFSRRGWIFELKYDGFRVLAAKRAADEQGNGESAARRAALIYRSGQEATRTFPEVARAVAALPVDSAILDGEVVVLEESGRPSFQRLQKRAQLQRAGDIERGTLEHPATYFAFDLLACEGLDLRGLPLVERKRLLRDLLPGAGPLRYADHVEERGEALYEQVRRSGLEGLVGKRADSAYVAGRSPHWQKIRADHEHDLVVVGYTRPKGSRSGLGALHLAGYDGERLVYAGRVGTGFTDAQLRAFAARLDARRLDSPPCAEAPAGKEHVWSGPALVAAVRFKERTDDGQLRQPVFLRLRDDKKPEECELPDRVASTVSDRSGGRHWPPNAGRARRPAPTTPRRLKLSNLDKVFWPDEGYTKGDLLDYYRAISPWLLPYLRERPLVLDRYPDGIRGKHFYQKDSPLGTPEWIRTEPLWSDDSSREIDYFICDDVETLLHIINLGTIPLHVWGSRLSSLERPDWSILDLDPKEASFKEVVAVAGTVRELCREIGLPAFPKTSGSTGLHVLLPIGGQLDFAQARQLAELLARAVAAERPDIATVERVIAQRGGRVYLDFLQNGHGKLLVAPFSARPLAGARVSTPLLWKEVGPRLDPAKFTITTVPRRMERLGEDPLRPILELRPELPAVLARLAQRWDRRER